MPVSDGGTDAGSIDALVHDGPSIDTPPDVGNDTRAFFDAFTPLALTEFDPSPSAPVPPPRRRPRALPADPTPRILWTRNIRDLGLEGYPNPGAIDRNGDLHFSTLLVQVRGAEIGADGTLLGYGFGFDRADIMGLMTILPDDHAAEWAGNMIRIDSSPPVLDTIRAIDFRDPGDPPGDPTRIAELAATSDGLYAFRAAGGGRLRKFCLDGRLQWELAGLYGGGMRVDVEDSIWIPVSDGVNLHVDRHGAILETVNGGVYFAGDSRWVRTLGPGGTTVISVRTVDGTERERFSQPLSAAGFLPDPLGGVWRGTWSDLTRFVDGVPVARMPRDRSIGSFVWGEDASLITSNFASSDERVTLYRILSDGSVAWELEVPGPIGSLTHDVDGRLYVYGGNHVTAIQTDVLPPNVRGCWQYRCNHLANLSVVPLPE